MELEILSLSARFVAGRPEAVREPSQFVHGAERGSQIPIAPARLASDALLRDAVAMHPARNVRFAVSHIGSLAHGNPRGSRSSGRKT